MRSANDFASKVNEWALTNDNLKPRMQELPQQVQPLQVRLEGAIGEARDLDNQLEIARADLREITRKRRDLLREGDKVRSQIGALIRGTFGFTSERLIPFGINPRPTVIRRKSKPTTQVEEKA